MSDEQRRKARAELERIMAEVDAKEPPIGQGPKPELLTDQQRAARKAELEARILADAAEEQARMMHPPAAAMQAPALPPSGGVDQTALATPALNLPALPFAPHAAAQPPPAAAMPAHEQVGETAFLAPIEGLDAIPNLTVEQYASLCAERALSPQHAPAIAQRYKVLSDQALQTLDAQWQQRLHSHGDLYRQFQHVYAQWEAWLRSQGR
jgi:hypothetical protein